MCDLINEKLIIDKDNQSTYSKMTERINYNQLSYDLTKSISKADKKSDGIYFTPPQTINPNLEQLEPYMSNVKTVLEPSCGSCEYVDLFNKKFQNRDITGIELNKTIYNSIQHYSKNNIQIMNVNFLYYKFDREFDLILGNPPFYVMKKGDVDKSYYKYFDGRPNIFLLFIIKSLNLLSNNGILSFILPKNFLNCLYYDKTRKHISENFKIISITECDDDYIETKQETVLVIIQKSSESTDDIQLNNNKYILNVNNFEYTIFGTEANITELNALYEDSTNLSKLNFNVTVGSVVWNQCKSILTDDTTKTRLIYSSDIVKNKLSIKEYNNYQKKNYIHREGIDTPLLVVNRGYGVGNYVFQYCLITGGFKYLIENHLICIKYTKTITDRVLMKLYNKIITSLNNEKTKRFINLYFGNNAINTTELNHIMPIYDV